MPRKFDPPTVGYLRHSGVDVGALRLMGLNEFTLNNCYRVVLAG